MISEVYAMAPRQGKEGQAQPGMGQMLFPLVIVFFIFYFLIIRPQKRKDQTHKKFLAALKKGDDVITQSGIYGRITGVADHVVTLEVADKVRIKVARQTVAGYQVEPSPANQKKIA